AGMAEKQPEPVDQIVAVAKGAEGGVQKHERCVITALCGACIGATGALSAQPRAWWPLRIVGYRLSASFWARE
ncbi:MAG TPA: hypothetical protein VF208_10005, partial [Candidatus Binatia bacterium]